MDMNKTFFLAKEAREPRWIEIDAEGEIVGRLASKIANMLRGKNKTIFTPHTDAGDYVVVINADKIVFTGDKMTDKEYERYTGYLGGYRVATPAEKLKKDPAFIIEHAVRGMLPKNKLARQQIKKLKVYAGSQHPHKAQIIGFAPKAS